MEIEYESNDSGDDISDGDAECLFCTRLFLHDKHGEKWVQCVRCYRWAQKIVALRETTLCAPCTKKCKIVSYIIKTYYLILGHHFYFGEK
jgi:hypothetical protein